MLLVAGFYLTGVKLTARHYSHTDPYDDHVDHPTFRYSQTLRARLQQVRSPPSGRT